MKKIMVVYTVEGKGIRGTGIGNCILETDAGLPLSEYAIREIEKDIAQKFGYRKAVMLNYLPVGE